MATRALREGTADRWQALLAQEAESGDIPLPALDTLIRDPDGHLSISLVAPDIIPDSIHIFVAIERMSPADAEELEGVLYALDVLLSRLGAADTWQEAEAERVIASKKMSDQGRNSSTTTNYRTPVVTRIFHEGGLGYEFHLRNKQERRLFQLPEDMQPLIWGLIQALVRLCKHYPDIASQS